MTRTGAFQLDPTGGEQLELMANNSLALYDAFSEQAFGGSQAAIVLDAASLDRATRTRVAREIGMPATAFVDALGADWIQAQFMSTVMELPMCGHGTICLVTHLCETDAFSPARGETLELELRLPDTRATVEVLRQENDRYQVMLDVAPSQLETFDEDPADLLKALGLDDSALAAGLPIEVARGDFVHLVLPLSGLAPMHTIAPDFGAIVDFCRARDIETVALFCTEVEDDTSNLHVRDFCPAVGVAESAAAGTTNAALACYLLRHGLVDTAADRTTIRAEQGLELGRPSSIQSVLELRDGAIARLQVGGIATRVIDGHLQLPG